MNERELLIAMLTRIGHELDIFEDNVDDDFCSIRYVFNKDGLLINSYVF